VHFEQGSATVRFTESREEERVMSTARNPIGCEGQRGDFITGCVLLDVIEVTYEERAYLEERFGSGLEVDRVARFYIVHRDSPSAELRLARVHELQTSYRPGFCEHCAEAVNRGGLFLYDSPRHSPKQLEVVPVERSSRRSPWTRARRTVQERTHAAS
jgi:hypothetical protein